MNNLHKAALLWTFWFMGMTAALSQGLPQRARYHGGDHPDGASIDLDDSGWTIIDIGAIPTGRDRGWIRIPLSPPAQTTQILLGLRLPGWGEWECFVDGIALKPAPAQGPTENGRAMDRNPMRRLRLLRIENRREAEAVLAIRFSLPSRFDSGRATTAPVLKYELGPYHQLVQAQNLRLRRYSFHQMFMVGSLCTFALLHLLFFGYYPQNRANLHYALLAGFSAVIVYAEFLIDEGLSNSIEARYWLLRNLALLLHSLALHRLTHALLLPRPSRVFYACLIIALPVGFLACLDPFRWLPLVLVFVLLNYLEVLRDFALSWLYKRSRFLAGSWLIGLGLLPLILAGIYQTVGALTPLRHSFQSPLAYYTLFALLISMSVVLARNFARTRKALENRLGQVRDLHETETRQDLERVLMVAEHGSNTKELDEARDLQLAMLPKTLPRVPGLELGVYMKTATEVGGDYYDFHYDGTLTAAIGDATGHGLRAGTLVAATKSLFNAWVHCCEPVPMLKKISSTLKELGFPRMFMALTLVKYREGTLRLAAAGMPFPLVYRADSKRVEVLEIKALPLGRFPDFPYRERTLTLASGDVLLLSSDGLMEMFNAEQRMFGQKNMVKAFREAAHHPPDRLISHLLAAGGSWTGGHPQEDDVTFVVLKRK